MNTVPGTVTPGCTHIFSPAILDMQRFFCFVSTMNVIANIPSRNIIPCILFFLHLGHAPPGFHSLCTYVASTLCEKLSSSASLYQFWNSFLWPSSYCWRILLLEVWLDCRRHFVYQQQRHCACAPSDLRSINLYIRFDVNIQFSWPPRDHYLTKQGDEFE